MELLRVLSLVQLWLVVVDTLVLCGGEAYGQVLYPRYYEETCPLAEEIVREVVAVEVVRDPFVAAQLLRLHFHDCFVLGCDASVLLDDDGDVVSEKAAVPNVNSLRGFEIIDRAKALLEEACPLTVSCADIIAMAARDSVHLRGGPNWEVYLGRRDSLKASLSEANQMIPAPNFTLQMLISNFESHGLNTVDLVALSGGHTMGRSRCLSFRSRIYGQRAEQPPEYHRRDSIFRRTLRSICPAAGRDNALTPLDILTPARFDNLYFHSLLAGQGLLETDAALVSGAGWVRGLVYAYAADQDLFFRDFAGSMLKMGSIGVLTGEQGEVRRSCRHLNDG
uniref:Peroxidase n=1 Tax=Anthurium amnicola TaxID=1678845 RepID=A0A1D1ZL27_9ARAE